MELRIPNKSLINENNIEATATDFAKILGVGTIAPDTYHYGYLIEDYDKSKQVNVLYNENLELSFSPKKRFMGIRLVVNFSDISKYCSNIRINKNGYICSAECFMYPKNVTDNNIRTLNALSKMYSLDPTNPYLNIANSITVDSYPIQSENPFFPKTLEQYIVNKKIYVKVLSNTFDKVKLSNNKTYDNKECIWFESSPIIWDINQKNNIAMTHDIIVSGVPFDKKDKYKGNFDKTDLYEYLNTYLKKDLISSIPYSKGGKAYKKTKF